MRYTELKTKTGVVSPSKIVLGTTYYGSDLPDEASFALMDRFLEMGGTCIDTARAYNIYSGPGGADQSERCIGLWMEARHCRERVVLSTKGGHNLGAGTPPRLDPPTLRADLERSLTLLRTDRADIYWLHRDDPNRPVGGMLETVEDFLEHGWIRTAGASNWPRARLEEARVYAETHGLSGFSAGQIQWSLATTSPDRLNDPTLVCMTDAEFGYYKAHSLPVFGFSSQAKGFFSKYCAGAPMNEKLRARYANPENIETAERVRAVADKHGVSPTTVALHFVLDNALPACGIVGCSTVPQLEETMRDADFVLPREDVAFLRRM